MFGGNAMLGFDADQGDMGFINLHKGASCFGSYKQH